MNETDLLVISLQAAVPLFILRFAGMTPEARAAQARAEADVIAAHGDDILFRARRRGETADAFNALARGLALAAYQPGGVTFAGAHFCTDHAACRAAEESTNV